MNLPHQEPILFAKEIVSIVDTKAIVKVNFQHMPTLAMLVESAAQSSAVFSNKDIKKGFLVRVKNVKLLKQARYLDYEIAIILEHNLDNLTYFNFTVSDKIDVIAQGILVIAIE